MNPKEHKAEGKGLEVLSETDFIRSINNKDRSAYYELFRQFRDYLVIFVYRRIRQIDIAEDIVQEVFISVWETDKVFNSYQGFRAYLFIVAHNKCINYWKRKDVENKYHLHSRQAGQIDDDTFILMQEDVYRILYQKIAELPEKCRQVFSLHMDGKKNAEIAEILGISILTVKAHKQNAVRFLRDRMKD